MLHFSVNVTYDFLIKLAVIHLKNKILLLYKLRPNFDKDLNLVLKYWLK